MTNDEIAHNVIQESEVHPDGGGRAAGSLLADPRFARCAGCGHEARAHHPTAMNRCHAVPCDCDGYEPMASEGEERRGLD